MEHYRTQESRIERIPTIDSFDDIDQARLYINETLLAILTVEEAAQWWDQAAVSLDSKTPYALWAKDPNTVIRWAHTFTASVL